MLALLDGDSQTDVFIVMFITKLFLFFIAQILLKLRFVCCFVAFFPFILDVLLCLFNNLFIFLTTVSVSLNN